MSSVKLDLSLLEPLINPTSEQYQHQIQYLADTVHRLQPPHQDVEMKAENITSTSHIVPQIRPPQPSKFDGTDRKYAGAWLESMNDYFIAVGLLKDDPRRLIHVKPYLTNGARIWWSSVMKSNPAPTEWKDFVLVFNAFYQPISQSKNASYNIRNLRQITTVEKYTDLFRAEFY
jgi:hypothetical protein